MSVISVVKKSTGSLIDDDTPYYYKDSKTGTDVLENGDEDEPMSEEESEAHDNDADTAGIITPGKLITDDSIWMRGHGTYSLANNTYSSVCGTISKVNKLLSVKPLNGRYQPETGDHVIGRIVDVGNKRWKVDIGAKQHAILMLGSVNLPGGVLRRKSESDELQMRSFLKEGDLLNAEVQSLFSDGAASLHTRSLKYGKLRNGLFVQVPSSLIVRSKDHTHDLPGNITVILGVNGYVWIRKTTVPGTSGTNNNGAGLNNVSASASTAATLNYLRANEKDYQPGITRLEEESSWEIYSDKNDNIPNSIRQTIVRYSNVVKSLAHCQIGITEQRVIQGYEASMAYPNLGTLIETETMESLGQDVINAEKMRG